jgi:hypothetical protein
MGNKEALEEVMNKDGYHESDYDKIWREGVQFGVKWQQEQMFDIMQQYAAFCVKCDREKLPLLFAKDWFEQFKNK